jgi:hypothetical protein
MDELLLAVFRQGAEANLRRQARALSAREPLRALWKVNSDPRGVKLYMEFIVLSYRDEAIRAEIAAYAERFREAEKKTIARVLHRRGIDAGAMPPGAASVLIDGLARIIAIERALGVSSGHDDMVTLIENYIGRFEANAAYSGRGTACRSTSSPAPASTAGPPSHARPDPGRAP